MITCDQLMLTERRNWCHSLDTESSSPPCAQLGGLAAAGQQQNFSHKSYTDVALALKWVQLQIQITGLYNTTQKSILEN